MSTENVGTVTPVVTPAATPVVPEVLSSDPIDENYIPQSKVNKIVAGTKKSAYEKGVLDGMAQIGVTPPVPAPVQNAVAPEDFEKKITEAVDKREEKKLQEQQAVEYNRQWQETEKQLETKIKKGMDKYPDYIDTIAPLQQAIVDNNNTHMAQVILQANGLDNTEEVLYALGKHPQKLLQAVNFTANGLPNESVKYLQELSKSLMTNSTPGKTAPAPLSQLTSSPIASSSNTSADNIAAAKMKYRG